VHAASKGQPWPARIDSRQTPIAAFLGIKNAWPYCLLRKQTSMAFAIKAEVRDLRAQMFEFRAQKTMYGGKGIGEGDTAFVFASENEGGQGLLARGIVTSSKAIAKKVGVERQTPRVSVAVKRMATAKRPLGRNELRRFTDWNDGQPQTELNFKLYRQATNKIIGISHEAAAFLDEFF